MSFLKKITEALEPEKEHKEEAQDSPASVPSPIEEAKPRGMAKIIEDDSVPFPELQDKIRSFDD